MKNEEYPRNDEEWMTKDEVWRGDGVMADKRMIKRRREKEIRKVYIKQGETLASKRKPIE
jgi:hypothetical protein